jgi:hypothetical protein
MSDPQRPEREAIEQFRDALRQFDIHCEGFVSEAMNPNYVQAVNGLAIAANRLLAAPAPTPTPGWQDISTAPKDGTFILIYPSSCWVEDVEHDYEVSYWDEDFGRWHFSALPDDYTGPTHWMPLPPAPTGDRS